MLCTVNEHRNVVDICLAILKFEKSFQKEYVNFRLAYLSTEHCTCKPMFYSSHVKHKSILGTKLV